MDKSMDSAMNGHLDGDSISDLAEGILDPVRRAAAEAHVQGCADCRRELEAVRGYLREMSALTAIDPIKAPPNFLANVRARLPQPSPLKRLLDGFLRPFRVIPMQLALLTVLGLTAISSYLYQRGGIHETPSAVPMSSTSTAPEPEIVSGLPANKIAAARDETDRESREGQRMGLDKADAPAEKKSARTPVPKSALPTALAKQKERSMPLAAGRGESFGHAAGSGASVGRIAPGHLDKPAAPPALAEPGRQAAPRPPAKTMAQAAARDDARPVPQSAMENAAQPAVEATSVADADQLSATAPEPALAYDAKKTADASKRKAVGGRSNEAAYEELESLSMKGEAAISASGESPGAAPAYKDEAARSEPKAKAPAPEELPGFSLRLARGKQSAEVLAGLKAMGVEVVSGPERAKSGEPPGEGYLLSVPASMIKDVPSYLARYGAAERTGVLPVGQSPVRILLRMVPSPK